MKVKCIRLKAGSQKTRSDGWVTIGEEYVVLGVYSAGGTMKYRLQNDEGDTPAFHDATLFEVASSALPGDWVFDVLSPTDWELSPKSFAENGFWELFFDGDDSAEREFAHVAAALGEAH